MGIDRAGIDRAHGARSERETRAASGLWLRRDRVRIEKASVGTSRIEAQVLLCSVLKRVRATRLARVVPASEANESLPRNRVGSRRLARRLLCEGYVTSQGPRAAETCETREHRLASSLQPMRAGVASSA